MIDPLIICDWLDDKPRDLTLDTIHGENDQSKRCLRQAELAWVGQRFRDLEVGDEGPVVKSCWIEQSFELSARWPWLDIARAERRQHRTSKNVREAYLVSRRAKRSWISDAQPHDSRK